jgi:hypothetical protein
MTATLEEQLDRAEGDRAVAPDPEVKVTRRRIDNLLIALGIASTAVLLIAGFLLNWGSNFAEDYVSDELSAQNISFPDEDSLVGQGREDLVKYAGAQVTTGDHAEAYASFIAGHVAGIADGQTYADLGGPERSANAAVTEAIDSGAPADEVAALEADAAAVTAQRDSVYKGEMLRGALLNTYAWSTIGRIAGIAAVVAFGAAIVTLLLVVAGGLHIRRVHV